MSLQVRRGEKWGRYMEVTMMGPKRINDSDNDCNPGVPVNVKHAQLRRTSADANI